MYMTKTLILIWKFQQLHIRCIMLILEKLNFLIRNDFYRLKNGSQQSSLMKKFINRWFDCLEKTNYIKLIWVISGNGTQCGSQKTGWNLTKCSRSHPAGRPRAMSPPAIPYKFSSCFSPTKRPLSSDELKGLGTVTCGPTAYVTALSGY